MDYLFDLQEPGSLGALVIPAVLVSGWVLDKVAPPKALLEARRKAKARRLHAEVRALWANKELALDYLVLQGLTRKAAQVRYDKWAEAQRQAANGMDGGYRAGRDDALDDPLHDLYA